MMRKSRQWSNPILV